MKIFNMDVNKLIELLDQAKGNIYLMTNDGNTLNLKSKLCQLYGVKTLLETAQDVTVSPELKFDNSEDEALFIKYLLNN